MTFAEGSKFFPKLVETIKDLPAWLYTALAVAAGLMLFVPGINHEMPKETRPWLVGSVVLFGVLATFKWLDILIAFVRARHAAAQARKTFHVTVVPQQCRWAVAKQPDDSLMTQIHVAFSVKNISASPVGLTRVRLIKPRLRGEVLHDMVMIREQQGQMHGTALVSDHRVAAGTSLPGSATLHIIGRPPEADGEDLKILLGISDEDGHEERVNVVCKGIRQPKPADLPKPLEALNLIRDPIEQGVAAVLQTEISRYELNGRRTGGLGSLSLDMGNGQQTLAFGGEAMLTPASHNQEIVDAQAGTTLRSDNFESLMALYERSAAGDERERFATALLTRLQSDRGYGRVAYLIVLVLWKIGRLDQALAAAIAGLPSGDQKEFGLSNSYMMLNGMLRHKHPDFTPEALDAIESALRQTAEHPFRIPQKIAAVRAHRIITRA